MFNCNICKNISKYDIILKSLSMNNNFENMPSGLKVGMKAEFLNIIEEEKNMSIPFSLNIAGVEVSARKEDKEAIKKELRENIDMNNEDLLFEINIIHELRIEFEKQPKFDENDIKSLKDYAYFILEPTISELVASLGTKIGIGGLRVPKNVRKFKNGNNN